MGSPVFLKQGEIGNKPKARVKREGKMFSWLVDSHSLQQIIVQQIIVGLAMGAGMGGLIFVIVVVIPKTFQSKEYRRRKRQFKRCFHISVDWRWFSKDTSYRSWRDKNSKQGMIIQHRIDNDLPPLAKPFLGACEKENAVMNPYYSDYYSDEGKHKINEKKDLRRISKIQKEISSTNEKFQNAVKVAKEGGFKASESAKDYEKKEKGKPEKEKEESKEEI